MAPPLRSARSLLIVDDQRLDRVIASHAAAQAGFAASGAGSVHEVRDLLESGHRFDFVVLDLSLGHEDGLEVLQLVARLNRNAVIILASGFDGRILAASQRVAEGFGLPVAGVLRKPVMPSALRRLLERTPLPDVVEAEPILDVSPAELGFAIADGRIQPWFQPKIALNDGAVVGAEGLARWLRADGRMVNPATFIPIAEQHGMIGALTDSMLDQALRACARWRVNRPDCWVAVNISPLLLGDPALADRVDDRLHMHGVPPSALVLEITENNSIADTAGATKILTRLRIRGVNLSIDDFGTGHSSLLSLMRMPFNEMKIDQAFVREAIVSRDARKVVRASASLGRELGLNVVAEGVETTMMADIVGDAGCHVGQGWLYGKAVPSEQFEARLAEDKPRYVPAPTFTVTP